MLSTDGFITESSVANLLIVQNQTLVVPPPETVLQGLSLQRTLRLAAQLQIPVQYRCITLTDAKNAEAILMTGTSGCLWPASRLAEDHFHQPTLHPVYLRLQAAWINDLELDYVEQAISISGQHHPS